MFFLGVSAHLIIYLLVPAFLIVFFYFKGIPGNPEVTDIPPVVAAYEPVQASLSEGKVYRFRIAHIQKQTRPKINFLFYEFSRADINFIHKAILYTAPILRYITLRAPPAW